MGCGCRFCKPAPVQSCNTFSPTVSDAAVAELICEVGATIANKWLCVVSLNTVGITNDTASVRDEAIVLTQYRTLLEHSWCLCPAERESAFYQLKNLIRAASAC